MNSCLSQFRKDGPCAGSGGMVAGVEEEEDWGSGTLGSMT